MKNVIIKNFWGKIRKVFFKFYSFIFIFYTTVHIVSFLFLLDPKSPIKVSISPKGEGYVNTPMLTALGFPSASVTATLFQMDLELDSFKGGVKDLPISGFVPEETYKIVVKHDDGDWSSELTFPAGI